MADTWSYRENWPNKCPNPTWWPRTSGGGWACSSLSAGSIIWSMSQVCIHTHTHTHNDQSHAVSWCLTMAFTNCVLNIKVIIGEKWLSYFSEPHILLFRRPLPKQWHSVTLVSSGTFPWFSVNTGELNHVSGLLWPWCSDRIKGLWEMYFQWKCKGS